MATDSTTDRPRALLLQIEADPLADRQAAYDALEPEEREWFRAHHTWDGEIVTAAEFLYRLRAQQDAIPPAVPLPMPPLFRLAREPATTDRPRQRDLFDKE